MMRAAVLERPGIMRMRELAVPEPHAGDVLVRVTAVGVCGSDVHYYEHGRIGPYVVEHPLVLGHESAGVIEAVGDGVDPRRIGERVSIEPQRPCRACNKCKRGRYNLCPQMEFYATPPIDGAFSEFAVIASDFAHVVPDSVSDEAAALMEPLSVGIWSCQRADVGAGSRLVIAGAGPIGLVVAQTARAFGAAEVIVTDIDASRRQHATHFGATDVVDPTETSLDGLDVDAFIDATGAPQAVRQGIRAVAPGGRVVLVGMGADDVELPVSFLQNREIWLTGVFRYANTWPLAIDLVARGAVDLDALVTSRHPLADAERSLTIGREPGQLKAVVYPGR